MAKRSPSVLKRQRQEKKRAARNKMIKSKIKTFIKKAKKAAFENDNNLENYLKTAIKEIDKAASNGVIHKNTASRKKSRLLHYIKKYKTDIGQEQENQEKK